MENGKMEKQMDKDVLLILMEACMKVNGIMIYKTDKEQKVGIIIKLSTLEVSLKEKRVELGDLNSKLDTMKVNFLMDSSTDKESIIFLILVNYIKENFKIIIWMEKVLWVGQIYQNMKKK